MYTWSTSVLTDCKRLILALMAVYAATAHAADGEVNKLAAFPCTGDYSAAALTIVSEHRESLEAAAGKTDVVERVKAQLSSMRRADQDIRFLAMGLMSRCGAELDREKMRRVMESGRTIDQVNIEALKAILKNQGWPTISKFGKDSDNAAFLVVQHADRDREFQKEVLRVLEEKLRDGETSGESYALLSDRISVAEGKKQRFGSQGDCVGNKWVRTDSLSVERVNKNRKEIGLERLEEYEKKAARYICG